MRFIYKINSGYNGFTPARIPERLAPGKMLSLGWDRYIDAVEKGHEVWVYFLGPHSFVDGIYGMGYVHEVDYTRNRIKLRIRKFAVDRPLTDAETSERLADVVRVRYRQVFVLPEELAPISECDIATRAETCKEHHCTGCPIWRALPLIQADAFRQPHRLSEEFRAFVPAYWVIPRRCYLPKSMVRAEVKQTSELFYRFKLGEVTLSFPLALGMLEVLQRHVPLDFDCIVPIPLSPDKARNGEAHRTRLLAGELEELLGIRVKELLKLRAPVSKRRLLSIGYTQVEFEAKYLESLEVEDGIEGVRRVLLVDDVCTHGSTLSCGLRCIRAACSDTEIVALTAGQMITKQVIRDSAQLIEMQ